MFPVTDKYVHLRRSGVDNAVHDQSIKIIKRLRNIVSKKHLYVSFMVKHFISHVPQFSAVLIRYIYQLLVNKVLTINEDVLYFYDVA